MNNYERRFIDFLKNTPSKESLKQLNDEYYRVNQLIKELHDERIINQNSCLHNKTKKTIDNIQDRENYLKEIKTAIETIRIQTSDQLNEILAG